jgi:hypothetical protein
MQTSCLDSASVLLAFIKILVLSMCSFIGGGEVNMIVNLLG